MKAALWSRRAFLGAGMMAIGGALVRPRLARGGADSSTPAEQACRFFRERQDDDGAWRSAVYGAFRGGDALTPLVLWAMPASEAGTAAARKGRRWLERLTDAQRARREPWQELQYPLFTAAYAAQVLAAQKDHARAGFWADVIEKLRIQGWGSFADGAWGDAAVPPRLARGESAPDMWAPNLSATTLALQALRAVGRAEAARAARPFVEACQNFAVPAGLLDDGGFFFAPGDPIRNKAGIAMRDPDTGATRYRSYGCATCDGLLALQFCGVPPEEPRRRAALRWIKSRGRGFTHCGEWPPERVRGRESLRFYAAQGYAAVLRECEVDGNLASWSKAQRRDLATQICAEQNAEGYWIGNAADSSEDDPLVATAFALRAIA